MLWYAPYQQHSNIQQISYIGGMSTRIDYDKPMSKWILHDVISETSAESLALENTYVLGKHKWTIKNRAHWERCTTEILAKNAFGHVFSFLKLNLMPVCFLAFFIGAHFHNEVVILAPFTREKPNIGLTITKIEIWPKLRSKVINSPNQSHRDHFWGMFEL